MTAPTTLATGMFTGVSLDGRTYQGVEEISGLDLKRSSAKAETFSRLGPTVAAIQPITAQAAYTAIELSAGTVVTTVTFTSNTTAGATLSNQWVGLYSAALGLLAVSGDLTNTAWAASSEQVFTFATPFTIPSDGLYYLGLVVVATTVPTIDGVTGVVTLNARTPAVAFTDTAHTLTNPASAATTATNSAGFGALYAYIK